MGGLTLGSLTNTNVDEYITIFSENISGAVAVDMDNDDYTLTETESNSIYKLIGNAGDGTKTLTYPTAYESTTPVIQIIDSRLAGGNSFDVALESGGSAITISSGYINIISINTTLMEITNLCKTCAEITNSITNGVNVTDTVNNTFSATDAGKKNVFNAVGAQAWTIDTVANSAWADNAVLYIYAAAGSGGITVTGEAGVTLNPASIACAAGTSATIAKNGATDTWYRVT